MLSSFRRWLAFRPRSGALRIALVYCVVGLLWITFSDELIARFIVDRSFATWVSISKGYAYVLITALLLYAAIRRLHTQRRLTQVRLLRSERAYRTMFDDNPNPMFVFDPRSLCILDVNHAAVLQYGYAREEFLALTLQAICPSFTPLAPTNADVANFWVQSPVTHFTKRQRPLEMEVTLSNLRRHSRNTQLMMAQDISQRVRTERELLESRRQLREAQRIAGLGSWSVDHDSGLLTLSAQMYRLLGAAEGARAWSIQTLFSHVHPDDRAALQTAYDEAWRGAPLHIELRLLREGDIQHVLMRGELVEDADAGKQLMGSILDIDERKRYEKQLQESERQYRQLIDNLPEAVLIHRDSKVIFANPVAAQLFGAEGPDDLLGRDVEDFVAAPSKFEARARQAWLLGADERSDNYFRERLLRKLDGEVFAADVAACATLVDGARCIQAMVRDIGEQKKQQQELRQANERLLHLSTHMLESAENERRHLSRELHDDLGQSLTFIKMTAGWLRKRAEQGAVAERTEQLYVAASEAVEKVRDLSQALRPAHLETQGLKSAMEEHLHKYCDGGAIRYAMRIEDLQPRPDPAIETALFRIFQEALTNIFRHSSASFIEVELMRLGAGVTLRVADDGGGFDVPEALARGANLGLHTMAERAQQLRGEVQWHSVIGAGTAMTATIPESD